MIRAPLVFKHEVRIWRFVFQLWSNKTENRIKFYFCDPLWKIEENLTAMEADKYGIRIHQPLVEVR